MDNTMHNVDEKVLHPISGIPVLILNILMLVLCIPVFLFAMACFASWRPGLGVLLLMVSFLFLFFGILNFCGLYSVNPNEALVLVLFGKYYGTVKQPGYYFVNPFARPIVPASAMSSLDVALETEAAKGKGKKDKISAPSSRKRISLKVNTLNNDKQKVNDVLGNPVIIGTVVIWKVADPTKAVFNVEDYSDFLSTQCDLVVRNAARMFPYDDFDDTPEAANNGEKTLRGSSQEIADMMQADLQKRVEEAGLEIKDVRITNLAYSEEIAAAMLQRQQASAIIAARQKIVEGAVGMVKMALDQLDEESIVALDDERKAAMVSNLLVVLCGNKDAQPVINNGSIY